MVHVPIDFHHMRGNVVGGTHHMDESGTMYSDVTESEVEFRQETETGPQIISHAFSSVDIIHLVAFPVHMLVFADLSHRK